MWQQCWHSHPINHSRDWLYPIPRAPWVDPTIRCACEMDTMSSILPETPFQVHCTLTPTIWSVFEVMTFLHHQSCSTHPICGAPHGCMMLILFIEWQEWTGCTKASSHQTGLSLLWDTGRWRLTWCMLAPLCRNILKVFFYFLFKKKKKFKKKFPKKKFKQKNFFFHFSKNFFFENFFLNWDFFWKIKKKNFFLKKFFFLN